MPSGNKQKVLGNVKGPVFPVPTPFDREGRVDYTGLEQYVNFLLEKNVQTLMVTVGTSRFDVLTVEEMKKVNETVVRAAEGRAVTIVTTPPRGPTFQAVEFAEHAETVGADGILAVYPDRYYTDDSLYEFFKEIAGSCAIGVLIHLMPITAGRVGIGAKVHYSPELVERIAAVENMVGMKEESHDQGLVYKYNRLFRDRFLIIGGAGGMRAYLTAYQWGQPAYLVGLGNVFPEIEMAFYSALSQGDNEGARRIVFENEGPFFDEAVNVGWHPALKEAMAITGIMEPWERSPMGRLKRDDRERILKALKTSRLV